ncbi:MAG TPA: hypothetical protein VG477_08780, partial [Thermoanaerobaculia bacterium]|nr:hypothetical protein [Thermoanaerobaculia bacterium]
VITVAAMSLIQVSGNAAEPVSGPTYAELAACAGLRCNDAGDCGSYCFCNNPDDTSGSCYKDEETIEAFLELQKADGPGSH